MKTIRCGDPTVVITQNDNESHAMIEGIETLGILNKLTKEDVVVITPNWVHQGKAEDGIVVGAETLRTLIRLVKSHEPKRVVVATAPADPDFKAVMKLAGFDKVIEEEQAELVNLNEPPFVRVNLNHSGPVYTHLNKLYEEMTFLISFTQLKIHEEATVSASVKNISMGWPSAEEHGYPKKNRAIHDDLHGFIVAMLEKLPIDLAIVSANPVMVGTGPNNGLAYHTGLILCGTDAVATDTIGARLLGFKPQGVHYLHEAGKRGLGCNEYEKIKIKGMSMEEAESSFSRCIYGRGFNIQ